MALYESENSPFKVACKKEGKIVDSPDTSMIRKERENKNPVNGGEDTEVEKKEDNHEPLFEDFGRSLAFSGNHRHPNRIDEANDHIFEPVQQDNVEDCPVEEDSTVERHQVRHNQGCRREKRRSFRLLNGFREPRWTLFA